MAKPPTPTWAVDALRADEEQNGEKPERIRERERKREREREREREELKIM